MPPSTPASSRQSTLNPPAILLGLESMQGLQAARILAAHDIPVIAFARDPHHHNCRTNVCADIRYADTGSDDIVNALIALGETLPDKGVLYPCEDRNVMIVSRHRERLAPWYHVILPDHETVEMLADKVSFCAYCRDHDLPIPQTFVLTSRAEAEAAGAQLSYPCVLKPPHRSAKWTKATKLKAFRIEDAAELLRYYDQYSPLADSLLVQAWIAGPDANLYSCNCYFDKDGVLQASFIARKIRQWPPETGQSCLGVEVRADPVLEASIALFESVGYRGLGYVEMKRDERDGRFYLVEPNIGRPTGRSAIAEAGGVPLLYTMYCDAIGRPLPPNREQRYGDVKWIYWRRDVQSALFYWRRGDLSLRDWWRSVRGRKATAVFSWRDLAPFLGDLRHSLRIILSPAERRRRDPSAALNATNKESI